MRSIIVVERSGKKAPPALGMRSSRTRTILFLVLPLFLLTATDLHLYGQNLQTEGEAQVHKILRQISGREPLDTR
jgi:hypothetical protein